MFRRPPAKFSSRTRQAIAAEGKIPQRLSAPKRDEPSRRLDLSEVTEMGEFDPQAAKAAEEAQAAQPKSTAGVLAGSFLALWGAVLFFLPAFAVYLLVA